MLINESNQIPPQLLNGLTPKYFVQSYRNSPIRLEIDVVPTGSYFLNLFISRMEDLVYRFLVEISEARLQLISGGEMTLDYPFLHPENGHFFAALFDPDQRIQKLSLLSPGMLGKDNPIPHQLISFDLDLTETSFDLLDHAKKRKKIIIEIRSESKIFKSNLKYGSVRNILIPFSDLVKTALLNQNPRLSPMMVEDYLNFGYSYIGIGSLHALLELNHETDLFGFNAELENLTGLFTLLKADDPGEILDAIQFFKNKRIIPEYIRLLRSISKSGSGFNCRFATFNQIISEVDFDWARAQVIKNILESCLPETEYDEIVTGTLSCLDFENKKRPVFSLNSTDNHQVYSGYIDPSLDGLMNDLNFQFGRKTYECTLKVMFFPESLKKPEQYRYTLLRIEAVTVC